MARPTKFRHALGDLDSPALAAQVAGYVSEIELFRKQVEEIQKQIAEVYDDLDEEGFDKAIVRKLVAKRAKGSKADDEAEAIDAYEAAVEKGLSSRTRVENPVSTYPERVSRPAEIAAPVHSTTAAPPRPGLTVPASDRRGEEDDEAAAALREALQYDALSGRLWWTRTVSSKAVEGQEAGSPNGDGYLRLGLNGRRYLAHRVAWLLHTGCWPSQEIDHINRDGTDNRAVNLRQADRALNCINRGLDERNVCGVAGVRFHHGRWEARITSDGERVVLGAFETAEDAGAAYEAAQKAEIAKAASGPADPAPTADAKPRFTLPPAKPLRPNCLKPEACAGVGAKHCFTCTQAANEDRQPALEDEMA